MKTDSFGRRDFLITLGAAAGAIALGAPACAMSSPFGKKAKKPNIVFILIDDMGWSDVGCYGNKFNETPNIDRLAAQGMRFTDAYAACPVCSPTRASILSGQYPARVGVTDFITGHWRPYEKVIVPKNRTQYLPLEIVTFAEALKDAGYVSSAMGKWHLGWEDHWPDKQGFDEMLMYKGNHLKFQTTPPVTIEEGAYLADVLTDGAVKFIEDHKDEPFCLYLAHYAVHIPLQAKDDLIKKYENKPKPSEGVNNPIYAAMVEHVDNSVGRIVAKLDELDLSEDTIVIFFSDNGGLREKFTADGVIVTTNAPLRDEKGSLYEGGIREPLIVRWPGKVKAGTTNDTPVTSVDFYPTFLELAGAKKPKDQYLDGESILPLLKQKPLKDRAIYWHYPHYHHSRPAGAIRDGKWKLIEFFDGSGIELYDLEKDISEKRNLAKTNPEVAKRLQKKLAAWRESAGALMPEPNPDYDPKKAHEWGTHPDRAKIIENIRRSGQKK
jgi:uncharacterized sulfatase